MPVVFNGQTIGATTPNGLNGITTVVANGVTVSVGGHPNVVYLMNDFSGEAVQDSGGSNYDAALHNNNGSYSYDASRRILTLIGDASADSTYELPTDSEWTLIETYGVDVGSGLFNMFALNYKGDGTADVWYADQSNEFSLAPEDTGLSYTPTTFLSLKATLSLPKKPVATITMSSYSLTAGETATVTVSFDTDVTGLSIDDFTAENGTLSDFSMPDSRTATMTFTPDENVDDSTNVITLGTGYTDQYGNAPSQSYTSQNYEIHTIVAQELLVNGDFENGDTGWAYAAGITFSGGQCHFATDTNQAIHQTIDITGISTLAIEVEISNYVSGQPRVYVQDATVGLVDIPASNGVHTISYDVSGAGTNPEIYFYGGVYGTGGTWDAEYVSAKKES